MTIELRLSDVDPPAAEPKRTIYRDIVNLPDPVKLGITVRYFNYDDVGLYMQITGSAAGYTFGTVNLGLLASGANAYINLDEFASRAKPSVGDLPNGEMSENITLTLKGYTDAGYTTLKWTFDRVVTVTWINSADAAFTVDFLNNFDDGTVQGWAGAGEYLLSVVALAAATAYVLSPPYGLRANIYDSGGGYDVQGRIYKSFATPNKSKVFAVIDIRASPNYYCNGIQIRKNSEVLVQLGKWVFEAADSAPKAKWIRIVVPLPANVTVEVQIAYKGQYQSPTWNANYYWLDDFKIISK